jgi:hypothetical protein
VFVLAALLSIVGYTVQSAGEEVVPIVDAGAVQERMDAAAQG